MQLALCISSLAFGFTVPIGEAWFLLVYLVVVIMAGRFVFLRFEAPVQDLIRTATLSPSRARALA